MRLRITESINFWKGLLGPFFILSFFVCVQVHRFYKSVLVNCLLMSKKYSLEDLGLMNTHLKDSVVNLQVKLANGNLRDAEMQARSLYERIRELNGNSEYAD